MRRLARWRGRLRSPLLLARVLLIALLMLGHAPLLLPLLA